MTSRSTPMTGIAADLRLAAAVLLVALSGAALAFTTPPTIDTTPPVLTTAPQVVYVSDNSATLHWVTDEIADSNVSYGVTGGPLSLVGADVERVTEHLITLIGLSPTTAYSFAVTSTDPSGNTVTSATFSFTTVAAPDTTAPSFSAGPVLGNITGSSVEVTWTVSEPSSAVVAFGTSANALGQEVTSAEFKTGHSVTLTNLASSTTYYVAVTATDLAGNAQSSTILSFTTLAPPPPAAPIDVAVTATAGTFSLTWSPVSGATSYNVYRALQAGVTKANYATLTGGQKHSGVTSPFGQNANAAETWYFVMTAVSTAGESVESAEVSVTIPIGPDTAAPTVPSGITASAASSSQINLAWTASSDAVGVTQYKVYRGGVLLTTLSGAPPVTSYSDTGLAASTNYSYTVAACDAAGNCSAESATASATTLAAGTFTFTPSLEPSWNLLGNSLNTVLDVAAIFGNSDSPIAGITENIASVWKWNATDGRWAFYSPQLSVTAMATYAANRNYDVLSTISAGEGYWVNATNPVILPVQTGTYFGWYAFNFANLVSGFNLIATASNITPTQFNNLVNPTPLPPGVISTDNFTSLWAWDAAIGNWYFYSPLLESAGGLQAVKDYAHSRNYLHFQDYDKKLGIGTGFWVNKL